LELIQWVGVEREIEKQLWFCPVFDTVVDELPEKRCLPDAPSTNEPEKGLIFDIAARLIRVCEMVEITLLSRRE